MKKLFIILTSLLPLAGIAQIASWDFTGETALATSTAEVFNANLDASSVLTRGAGAAAAAGANSFRTQGFLNNGIAVTNTDYFENSFSAASGYTLSLSSINATFAGTGTFSNSPGVSMQYAYSLDGTTFTLIGSPFTLIGNGTMSPIDLSGVSELQNVPDNVTVKIRFYASGQTTTGGWGYNSPSAAPGLSFGGSVTPVVVGCATASTIFRTACTSYTVPSGEETYMTSGVYHDTIPNYLGCDSIITINLTITGPTTSTISPSNCTSYTVPSGEETYMASGVYHDTIPNYLGCDSIITINLTIVTSITFYADTDTDGLGDPNTTTTNCIQPGGFVTNSDDCDDSNASIGLAATWYLDGDLDGYGSMTTTTNCTQPVGYVANHTDCDDANAAVHPGATEIANNGIDEDCVGGDLIIAPTAIGIYEFTGNDCPGLNLAATAQPANATFSDYAATSATLTCSPAGNVINYSAWNQSSTVNTAQYYSFTLTPASCYGMNLTELHFTHKNSNSGGTPTVHIRSSLDGFAADIATVSIVTPNTLQNENITLPAQFATVYGAIEFRFYVTSMAASGATYRHDNVSLYGSLSSLPTATYYADTDGDTFGDAASAVTNCVPPAGYVTDNTDCNDNSAAEHPGASWAIDSDGDGFKGATTQVNCTQPVGFISSTAPLDCDDSNNAVHGQTIYYADTDGDSFGDLDSTMMACSQPVGFVTNSTDCDDTDNSVGAASTQYYLDADTDGFGNPNSFIFACSPQTGYVANNTDCNDSNPAVHPGATEICDGEDNDCDNDIDEDVPTFTFYADTDNDGLGNPNSSVENCSTPAGYVGNHNDCDDTDPTPNAGETVFYMDADNDTYGDDDNSISTCAAPAGYVATGGDCNDGNNAIHPGATDIPGNSIDENCDGVDGYLGLAEMNISNLAAYPNPGTASVTVTFNGSMENAALRFLGVDGKAVNIGKTEVSTSGITVSTLNLVPGIYFIEVTQGNAIQTVRWVKQ